MDAHVIECRLSKKRGLFNMRVVDVRAVICLVPTARAYMVRTTAPETTSPCPVWACPMLMLPATASNTI